MSRGTEKRKQSKGFRETRAQVWKVTEQREQTWRNLKRQGHPLHWMLNNMIAGTQDKVYTKRSQSLGKNLRNRHKITSTIIEVEIASWNGYFLEPVNGMLPM